VTLFAGRPVAGGGEIRPRWRLVSEGIEEEAKAVGLPCHAVGGKRKESNKKANYSEHYYIVRQIVFLLPLSGALLCGKQQLWQTISAIVFLALDRVGRFGSWRKARE
jgi:hypothetical protein